MKEDITYSHFKGSARQEVLKFADKYWPGPVTLICKAKNDVPSYIAPNGKIALRVPDNSQLKEVLDHFDGLFYTSANRAGESIPVSVNDIDEQIIKYVAAVINSSDKRGNVKPSMILDITTDDIIRHH